MEQSVRFGNPYHFLRYYNHTPLLKALFNVLVDPFPVQEVLLQLHTTSPMTKTASIRIPYRRYCIIGCERRERTADDTIPSVQTPDGPSITMYLTCPRGDALGEDVDGDEDGVGRLAPAVPRNHPDHVGPRRSRRQRLSVPNKTSSRKSTKISLLK